MINIKPFKHKNTFLCSNLISHKDRNPYCDIVEYKINDDTFITYVLELATGKESMEIYTGEN